MPATLASALRRAAGVGPFFALVTDPVRRDDGWRPASALLDEPAVLRRQADATRRAVADRCGVTCDDVDERAAASVHLLGLAARLVSPVLGAAVLGGVVPALDPSSLWWRVRVDGSLDLAASDDRAAAAESVDDLAALIHAHLVEPLIGPLVQVARTEFRTSPKVLWGDVASAVGGAVIILARSEPTAARRAAAVAAAVLGRGALSGTARVSGAPFRLARNSCCLYYRLPGGGTCADCVLRHPTRG